MSVDPAGRDTAATRRLAALSQKLGLLPEVKDGEPWFKYKRSILEFLIDRPPEEAKRAEWRSIQSPKTRVLAAIMRYSWCWPICMEYAVVVDKYDNFIHDHRDRPTVLTMGALGEILALSQQRINNVVLDLVAEKSARVETVPGRQHCMALFPEASPVMTEEERRAKSTLTATGVEGPRLEPAVLRRFTTLLQQLGEDEQEIVVTGSNGDAPAIIKVADYRTLVWKEIAAIRTTFLGLLKTGRYSERSAYAAIATRVRNLIDQRESGEASSLAAAVSDLPGSFAAKPAPVEARSSPTQRTGAKGAQGGLEPAATTLERMGVGKTGSGNERDPEGEQLAQVLGQDWQVPLVTYDGAMALLMACRKRSPQADPPVRAEEVLRACSEVVLSKGGLRSPRWRSLDNPMGLLMTVVPPRFPDVLAEYRRPET